MLRPSTPRTATLASCILIATCISAQVPERSFRKSIGIENWTAEERAALGRGEAVVRPLPTDDKQEIAAIGVVRIRERERLPISMEVFRESFSQKGDNSLKAGGRFSTPATAGDLEDLELDEEAIEQLRKCEVGSCDLNLPAEMITRLRRDVDQNGADATKVVTQSIREMLARLVNEYSSEGDRALGTYDNRRKTVDLTGSHRLLLAKASIIVDLAPEFAEYLKKFPGEKLEGVENAMHWSVVDFGLKPTITVSHAASYTRRRGDPEQFFVASKQIYSSRYLDTSLSFTVLLRVAAEDGIDTYVIFTDRSRSDALGGPLGGFARKMVQSESLERIKSVLDRSRRRIIASTGPPETDPATANPGIVERVLEFFRNKYVIGAVVVLLVAIGFVLWRKGQFS